MEKVYWAVEKAAESRLREQVWMAFTRLIDECDNASGVKILESARRLQEAL